MELFYMHGASLDSKYNPTFNKFQTEYIITHV